MSGIEAAVAIVELLTVTAEVLEQGYTYIHHVAKAPSEIRSLLSEVSAIDTLLDRIQNLSENNNDAGSALNRLSENGHLKSCHESVTDASAIIKNCAHVEGERLKNAGKRLGWPFKEGQIRDLLTRLERQRKHLTDAVSLDAAARIGRIEDRTIGIDTRLLQSEASETEKELLQWVCPVNNEGRNKHLRAREVHQHGTGKWLWESSEMKAVIGSGGLLWLTGPAGTGKTVLSSMTIQCLEEKYAQDGSGLAYFYFDSTSSSEVSTQHMLMGLLRHLLLQQKEGFAFVKQLSVSRGSDTESKLTTGELSSLLSKVIAGFDRIFVVIDALDEAQDVAEVVSVMASLSHMANNCQRAFLVTSRTDPGIATMLEPLSAHKIPVIDRSGPDLAQYVTSSVQRSLENGRLRLRNPQLADKIVESILEASAGLFLQASYHLEYIQNLKTDKAIKNALQNLPSGLNKTYERVLMSIRINHGSMIGEIRAMLIWLYRALEPVNVDMLAEAAGLDMTQNFLDYDSIATNSEDLVSLLGSLVQVDHSQKPALVSFSHLSLQEYLNSEAIKSSPVSEFYIEPVFAHQYIAEVCVHYLGLEDFSSPVMDLTRVKTEMGTEKVFKSKAYFGRRIRRGSRHKERKFRSAASDPALSRRLEQFALLRYAATRWPDHVRIGFPVAEMGGFRERLVPHCEWFLATTDSRPQFDSWHEVHYAFCSRPDACEYRQTAISFALTMGLECFFEHLFTHGHDLHSSVNGGLTPLIAAVLGGSPYIVQKLLDNGADVEEVSDFAVSQGFTALHVAAESSDAQMVQLPLSYGASVHSRTISKTTPFYRAVRSANRSTIQALHEAGSDVNARTWDNFTPLLEAVYRGRLGLVEDLVAWGADPLIPTNHGMTAVQSARFMKATDILNCFLRHVVAKNRLEELRLRLVGEKDSYESDYINKSLLDLGLPTLHGDRDTEEADST